MFFEFFVFFGVWWWLLVAAVIVLDVWFLEYDNGVGATISLLVFGALMFFFGDWNPFPWMAANPLWTVGVVIGYFAAGGLWSMMKWYFHCLNIRDKHDEIKDEFFEEHKIIGGKVSSQLKGEWKERLRYGGFSDDDIVPKARGHKSTILMWMTHWPFSAVWTLLNDPIRRIFKSIYARLVGTLQKISDRLFANTAVKFDDD